MHLIKRIKTKLIKLVNAGKTIYEIKDIFGVCKNTIRNWIAKENITTPKGFYATGKKLGRPGGFTPSDEIKKKLSEKFTGEGNPYFGRRHSKEIRKKMSDNHADISGNKNPFKRSLENNPNKRLLHKQRCLNIWKARDADYRKRFGEKLSLAQSNLPGVARNYKNHESGYWRTVHDKSVFYRSSWELAWCQALDKRDDIVDYDLESFCVPYTHNKQKKHTRIDFLIEFCNGQQAIIEVKPKGLIDHCKARIEAYRRYCKKQEIQFYLATEPPDKPKIQQILNELKEGKYYV